MADFSRDQVIRRLAAELLAQAGAARRNAAPPPNPAPSPAPQAIWRRLPGYLETTRKITVNFIVVVVGVILVTVTVKAALEPLVSFESVRIPSKLEEAGYGANSFAERVLDRMHAISQKTSAGIRVGTEHRTSSGAGQLVPTVGAAAAPGTAEPNRASDLASSGALIRPNAVSDHMYFGTAPKYGTLSSIQVPSSGINLQSVVQLLRDLIKPDDVRVTADLTVVSPLDTAAQAAQPRPLPLYVLQLRYNRGDSREAKAVQASDLDELIKAAAEAVLELVDPLVLAHYYYTQGNGAKVDEILDLSSASHAGMVDVRWASIIRCLRLIDRNLSDDATDCLEHVTKLDADMEVWGYDQMFRTMRWKQRAVPYSTWGSVLQRRGDYDGAIAKYKSATDFDPGYAEAFHYWGVALGNMGRYDDAIAKFEHATKLDPQYALAFGSWGSILQQKGDPDGAIEKYK